MTEKLKHNRCYTRDFLVDMAAVYGSIRAGCRAINKLNPENPPITHQGVSYFLNHVCKNESKIHAKMSSKTVQKQGNIKPVAGGVLSSPDSRRGKLSGKRFVFTSAQNNTFINEDFFDSLLLFCEHRDAQLFVSRFTYNKSGFQNSTKDGIEDLWYDTKILPYVLDYSVEVANDLLFCGELDILPTASNPLSGLETYCFGNSGIIPHAKVAMKSLPRLRGEEARFLYTTGAVTQRNYIQRKVGQKAEFHHVFGALYVEIDKDGDWFARQLIASNDGSFYDLTEYFTPDFPIVTSENVMAINWGDIHVEKDDLAVSQASFYSSDSILHTLKPTYQFIHDLTDFTARNHHEIKDPYSNAKKYHYKEDSVEQGLKQSAKFLEYITRDASIAVVVESNHHAALERWLKEANGHADPVNAEFWHRANYEVFKSIREDNEVFDVYEWALNREEELINVIFLEKDATFVICNDAVAEEEGKIIGGIECGIHGHTGINGARGSSNSFRTIGRKCNLGHSHSAGIIDGVYTAGVSGRLDMGYNHGASSWSNSHIVTYKSGKRAIITVKSGKWRA